MEYGQLDFFETDPPFAKDGDMWRKFQAFHQQNPDIYENFKKKIYLKFCEGKKISSYIVRENIRLSDEKKLNNNFAPYYLRTLIEENPAVSGFFRLKALKMEKLCP